MKILHRYILKQYLANLILGVLIFTFVLLLDHLFELVDLLINKGVGVALTLRLLALLLPSTFSLTLPIAHLLAALLTFGHLSETNEMTAIRASGLSAWNYIGGPVALALFTVVFLIPFNTQWAPHAHARFRHLYLQLLQRNPLVQIDEKTFCEIGDYHLYVEKKGKKSPRLRGVTIYKTPAGGAPVRIFAKRGEVSVDSARGMTFHLQEGHLQEIDTTRPHHWFYTFFDTYELFIPFPSQQRTEARSIEEMDNEELQRHIQTLREKRLSFPLFPCEFHLRWALAVTPLLFVGLGVSLALRVRRGGRSIGMSLSLLIVTLYYILIMGGVALGQRDILPPALAVWMGNAVMTMVAGALGWRFLRQ